MTADVKRRLLVVTNRGIVERARDRFTSPVEPAPGGL
jgi:hypothetical protein